MCPDLLPSASTTSLRATWDRPPPVVLQVAEGAVHEAGSELPTGDEEGVDRHQLAPEVGRGGLGDVHWHRHAGDACGGRGSG